MEVFIDSKELQKLYEKGTSKKLKLPSNVTDKFFSTIQKIDAAIDIYDLWNDPSLNFEKLQGEQNRYSIRLTIKYRLEISIEWKNENNTICDFYLEKISKHYGK